MSLVMLKSDPRARLKPCLRCGYSLRQIADARRCPECSLSVWISLSGNDDLELSNPAWLSRLSMAAIVLAVAHVIVFAGAAFIAVMPFVPDERYYRFEFIFVGLPYFLAAILGIGGAGLVLLSTSEERFPEQARGLRLTAKLAGFAAFGTAVLMVAAELTRMDSMRLMFAIYLVVHGHAIAMWAYLHRIARRIPSRSVRQFAPMIQIALTLSISWLFLRGAYWTYGVMLDPWSRTSVIWVLFVLIYPLIGIAMLIHLARAFGRASNTAATTWATESAHD